MRYKVWDAETTHPEDAATVEAYDEQSAAERYAEENYAEDDYPATRRLAVVAEASPALGPAIWAVAAEPSVEHHARPADPKETAEALRSIREM